MYQLLWDCLEISQCPFESQGKHYAVEPVSKVRLQTLSMAPAMEAWEVAEAVAVEEEVVVEEAIGDHPVAVLDTFRLAGEAV